jgi:Flp pilus assembly protein protease CpaA
LLTFFFLSLYSLYDLRERIVPNRITHSGIALASGIVLIDGQLILEPLLHTTAVLFSVMLSYVLYRLGTLGGADVKALMTLAIASPGSALMVWDDPILEAVISIGSATAVMLLLGFLYWKLATMNVKWNPKPPLIPFLLMAFIAIQIIALF